MRTTISTLAAITALLTLTAYAQDVQKSEDIVRFFANAVDLGAKRGICVGTEDECKPKQAEQAKTGLDMLVNFELNSAELTPDAQRKLGEFAKALQDNRLRSHSFLVEGYTDASGAANYNEELSQKRARSVTAFLLSNGVDAARINAIGKGEADPRVADPFDPANRRVEMRIKLQ